MKKITFLLCLCIPAVLFAGANENLHKASTENNGEAVLSALEAGADVNSLDDEGNTVLHKAIVFDNIDLIALLIEVPGININAKSKSGHTPLQAAQELYKINSSNPVSKKIIKLLKSKKAK